MIEEILDALIQDKEIKKPVLSPQDQEKKNTKSLQEIASLGMHAIELENSAAFQLLVEPYVKSVLRDNIRVLISDWVQLTIDEKNQLMAEVKGALNIHALIKGAKNEAIKANKILNVKLETKEKGQGKEAKQAKKEHTRKIAINRKVGADKRRKK